MTEHLIRHKALIVCARLLHLGGSLRVLGDNPQARSRCNPLRVSGCGLKRHPDDGGRKEAFLPGGSALCCLRQGAPRLCLEKAFSKGLVGVRQRGGRVIVNGGKVDITTLWLECAGQF